MSERELTPVGIQEAKAAVSTLVDLFSMDLTIREIRARLVWMELKQTIQVGVGTGVPPQALSDMLVELEKFVPEED